MDKQTSFNIWYVIAAVLAILFIQGVIEQARRIELMDYGRHRSTT